VSSAAKEIETALGDLRAGRFEAARKRAARLVAADRRNPTARAIEGEALLRLGRPADALAVLAGLAPDVTVSGEYLHLHGLALVQCGRTDDAVATLRRVVARLPHPVSCLLHLALIQFTAGRAADAAVTAAEAVRRAPEDGFAHHVLGTALVSARRDLDGIAVLQRAIALRPDDAETWDNLAAALIRVRRIEEAEVAARGAIARDPRRAGAHSHLGVALRHLGRYGEALASFRTALAIDAGLVEAMGNAANVHLITGDATAAAAQYRAVVAHAPGNATLRSNALLASLYQTDQTAAMLRTAHEHWARDLSLPPPAPMARPAKTALTLGFVSADLGQHPVGLYTVAVLAALARVGVRTVCYADRINDDAVTTRIRAASGGWVESATLDDEALAARIRADGIDVLFDLAGHTDNNRLGMFARRAAPLQITWIGYPGTTGVAAIDVILTDRHMVPEGAEANYSERVLRHPESAWCYDATGLRRNPVVRAADGPVVFGCFNSLAKINPAVASVWAEILAELPGSRLVLMAQGLADAAGVERMRALFGAAGLAPERLELSAFVPPEAYLAAYDAIDVALDPFPFGGCTTSCDALSRGVPVVTLVGDRFAGRMGLSFLANVGAEALAAEDRARYVAIAVGLAGDPARRAALRTSLPARMRGSALVDADRFVAGLMPVLRAAWAI